MPSALCSVHAAFVIVIIAGIAAAYLHSVLVLTCHMNVVFIKETTQEWSSQQSVFLFHDMQICSMKLLCIGMGNEFSCPLSPLKESLSH